MIRKWQSRVSFMLLLVALRLLAQNLQVVPAADRTALLLQPTDLIENDYME